LYWHVSQHRVIGIVLSFVGFGVNSFPQRRHNTRCAEPTPTSAELKAGGFPVLVLRLKPSAFIGAGR
jgi:hypothetical protein